MFVETGEGANDGLLVDDIEDDALGAVTGGLELGYRFIDGRLLATVDDDCGAGDGETFGQRITDAANGTGDQRGAAAQIEQWGHENFSWNRY